jgi:hypothetical protein
VAGRKQKHSQRQRETEKTWGAGGESDAVVSVVADLIIRPMRRQTL